MFDRNDAVELFRRPPERTIDVGEGEVGYRQCGDGPDVLFVHGWPASGATFRNLLPYLAPHVTCHVIDLVGAGQSRFDRTTRIDLRQHVRNIRVVIDTLPLERYAVVGHDSGGMMARHAVAGDARLSAMVLVDTEQPQGLNHRFRQFLRMSRLPAFEHLLAWAGMQPRLRAHPRLLGDCFRDTSLLDGEFEEFVMRPLRDDRLRRWAAGRLVSRWDDSLVDELAEVHARIDADVHLIWGEDDPFFPVEWAREMVESFPRAKLDVIPGGKLFVHEEFPEAVAERMLPTLTTSRAHPRASA